MEKKAEDGGRGINLKEPSLVRIDYEMTWMKRKIDLRELAKLRKSGLSLREIAKATGEHKTTLWRKLKELKIK